MKEKETCNECRYRVSVIVKGTGRREDNWCCIKDKETPKNPCKYWRPKAREVRDEDRINRR
jgi:hypothetical protein